MTDIASRIVEDFDWVPDADDLLEEERAHHEICTCGHTRMHHGLWNFPHPIFCIALDGEVHCTCQKFVHAEGHPMTFVAKYDPRLTPGTWQGATLPDGTRRALLACTRGHIASLSSHEIAADGTVTPSVVCPEDGCDFHEFVQLEGWKP